MSTNQTGLDYREKLIAWFEQVSGLANDRQRIITQIVLDHGHAELPDYVIGYLHGLSSHNPTIANSVNTLMAAHKLARESINRMTTTVVNQGPQRDSKGRFTKRHG